MQRRDWIESSLSFLGGAGIGAALMYAFDPVSGRDRRGQIADTALDTTAWAGRTVGSAVQGAASGSRRLLHNVASRMSDWADSGTEAASDMAGQVSEGAGRWLSRGMSALGLRRQDGAIDATSALIGAAGCFALGAALMFIFDPQTGRGRRAYARDKAMSMARRTSRKAQSFGRHAANKAQGMYHEAKKATGMEGESSSHGSSSGMSSFSGAQTESQTPAANI